MLLEFYYIIIIKVLLTTMIGQENRFNKTQSLLPQTKRIRNVSIVAHVDHGKTTLADCLIASNNIIHKKQAGHLKLLDDRIDEQVRGITMKSSSICLYSNDHLINLIDSPGHLQFYCEVSTALRLTDSALLVVDVVEGVSSQTFRVLDQLYAQKLPSILVLNKIDKLITHCKMDPMEAYAHINQIIEQVNAVLGSFITKQVGVDKNKKRTKSQDLSEQNLDRLEGMFYFSHTKKNIIFSSALDNWGFAVENFADLLAKKMGLNSQQITKYLWGDYYFYPKKKQFREQPKNQNDRPLCVDFILKPIWDIFQSVQNGEKQKISNIITKLKLKVSEKSLKTFDITIVREILNAWLPLDKVLMSRIIEVLPNPIEAQQFRLPYLLNLNSFQEKVPQQVCDALFRCSHAQKQPLIIFISKMVNIPKANINQQGLNQLDPQKTSHTLGFGRIFSGHLQRGSTVYVIGAKKKKKFDQNGQFVEMVPDVTEIQINNFYVFNAQHPSGISDAYAGNIVGIAGLQNYLFKSGTLSSIPNCISFIPVVSKGKSILKVSVSTPDIKNNGKMLEGLKRLNKSDPSIDVFYQPSGDIILSTCGQVHLQKCLVDLEGIYCNIPIKFSQPIINFKETIVWTDLLSNKNQKYIEEFERKIQVKKKKQMMQKLKGEMKLDAELDQMEKQKLKAVKQWDYHVEIYTSDDLTTSDTRFFFKNWDVDEQQKFNYKDEKILKKTDHKNRGKMHSKQKFLNLNMKTNISSQLTQNQFIKITVRALGMNFDFAEYLEKSNQQMKKLFYHDKIEKLKETPQEYIEKVKQFRAQFEQKMKECDFDNSIQELILNNIICFGPNGYGPNILCIPKIEKKYTLFQRILNEQSLQDALKVDEKVGILFDQYKTSCSEILNSILLGFSLACTAGPLCNEPLMGVIFILENIQRVYIEPILKVQKTEEEKIERSEKKEAKQAKQALKELKAMKQQKHQVPQKLMEKEQQAGQKFFSDVFGPLSGQVMSSMKDACIEAFLGGSPRLVEPMYLCQLQTDEQYYGQIHNELSKRRAKILEENLHEFSNVFIIKSLLPIVQSFKFCFEMLDKTQGTVNAQLDFDTWKIYTEDPFFTPLTQQQIQENGLQNLGHNSARELLDRIRLKKGLRTTEKIVTAAEKQRTLKKK